MKKIAMISEAWYPHWGGGQEVALHLSTQLSKMGYTIDLYTMDLGGKKKEKVTPSFSIQSLGKRRSWSLLQRLSWGLLVLKELAKKKQTYDYYYGHSTLPGLYIFLLGLIRGKPTIFHIHGIYYLVSKKNILYYLMEFFLFKILPYRLTFSADKHLISEKTEKYHYLKNGVVLHPYQKPRQKIQHVTYVGRFDHFKGTDILLSVIEELLPFLKEQKAVFHLCGFGEQEEAVKAFMKKQGHCKEIVFEGKLMGSEKEKLFKKTDLFVHCGRKEAFGITFLEAMSYSIPLVSSHVGILEHEVPASCFYGVKKPQKELFVKQIKEVFSLSAEERGKGTKKAHDFVSKHYDWKTLAKKVDTMISKL